ncbi:uncharacterized protein LOC122047339 isoform X1 [Zingiber officinale]|uniref:uncharacterized protein LOC122047339 isoform X1 n=1 Tax=Zingiber officinale TaxID=94328 RepID=UPI001C4D4CB8|nr:uncharacterized protein LOC122047339 isoform X1 [Zingiber officinale]
MATATVAVAATCSSSLLLPRRKNNDLQIWKTYDIHRLYPYSRIHFSQKHVRGSFTKLQASGDFADPKKASIHLHRLADKLLEVFPKPLKEFPWEEAKKVVLHQLVFLGKTALKWSFIVLYALSFLSDISLSISCDLELLIPVGLFIGVSLAEFLKESLQEFFKTTAKNGDFDKHLLGIGSLFVLVKCISLCFQMQGRLFLSHAANGGLMQVLWLARRLRQTDDLQNQNTRSTNIPSSSG